MSRYVPSLCKTRHFMLVLATFQRDLGYRSALKPEWETPVPAPSGNVVGPYLRRIMWIIQIWWLSPFTS